MANDLLQLAVAIVVIALILFVLRRASLKSKARAPASVRERLGVEVAQEGRPKRERRRPRPGQPEAPAEEDKPKKKQPVAEEEEEEEDEEEADEEEQAEAGAAAAEEEEPDREAREAFKAGLSKTRGGFVARLGKLFGKKKIDAATVDELEEVLFTADIGPRAAERIFQSVKSGLTKSELEDSDKIWSQIRKTSKEILAVKAPPLELGAHKPFVLLVLGVNGVGKTPTIGKLASKWKAD